MAENCEKCRPVFLEAQGNILKCLVLTTIQRYLDYCHERVKNTFTIKRLE